MHDVRERHMQVIEKILQYLKSSPGKELIFRKRDTLMLKIYTTRYCMFLGESVVT